MIYLTAHFEADPSNNGNRVRFKSLKSGRYLRIMGDDINVGGAGGKWCVFKVHEQSKGVVKLESAELNGKYIAVRKNGNINVGQGGPRCVMKIFRQTD